MNDFRTLRLCVLTAGLFIGFWPQVWASSAAEQPNFLLIVSEDNGPALGCYGNRYVSTPNLDRLAEEGVLFDRAFVSQAGCSQSRASYFTGLYPHQNGQIGLATWRFQLYREDTPNIVRSLKNAGYRTGIIGKLHINPASAFPFDYKKISTSNFSRTDLKAYAESAEEFIGLGDGPFFLSVNYPDAHRPFLRQVGGMPARPLTAMDVKSLPYIGLDTETLRQNTADYYNCMNRLDTLVGDLLAVLNRSGEKDNTFVVYLGDHGADLIRGKRTCYEGGLRIPLIVRWPGAAKAGQVRRELVSTVDLFPTWLEAAGLNPVANLPGRSLAPLLQGRDVSWREYLFTEFHLHSLHNYYPQRAVRDDRYKLIQNLMPGKINPGYDFTIQRFYENGEFVQILKMAPEEIRAAYERQYRPPEYEFYDLENDPFEFRNLADSSQHREILERLQGELAEWRRGTSDPFLNTENVRRLKSEIEAMFIDGEYQKPEKWDYPDWLTQ